MFLELAKLTQTLKIFYKNFWLTYTCIASSVFIIGFIFRLMPHYFSLSFVKVIWSVNYIMWSLKLLDYCSIHMKFGAYVTIAAEMLYSAKYILGLLTISLLAFGLPKQTISYQNEDWHIMLFRNIFYKPYFMLYGEIYFDEMDPCYDKAWDQHIEHGTSLKQFNQTLLNECVFGHWVPSILQAVFMLIANLLLLNLLIAVFNDTFAETSKMAHEIWHYQRYYKIVEFSTSITFPPPFTPLLFLYGFLTALISCFTYCICVCCKKKSEKVELEEKGQKKEVSTKPIVEFKLPLSRDQLEVLHDFEEDCMEQLLAEKDTLFNKSKKERIRLTDERTEIILSEIKSIAGMELSLETSILQFESRLHANEEKLDNVIECLSNIGDQLNSIKNSLKGEKALPLGTIEEEAAIVDELKNLGDITPRSVHFDESDMKLFDSKDHMTDATCSIKSFLVSKYPNLLETENVFHKERQKQHQFAKQLEKVGHVSFSDLIFNKKFENLKKLRSSHSEGYENVDEESEDEEEDKNTSNFSKNYDDIRHIDDSVRTE